MVDFIEANPGLRVVNASLGANWYDMEAPLNPNTSKPAQAQMDAEDKTFAQFLGYLEHGGMSAPLIVAAAGNDSSEAVFGFDVIDTRWSSPFTNAAARKLTPHVLIVEAATRQGEPYWFL